MTLTLFLLAIFLTTAANASSGDQAAPFRACWERCHAAATCPPLDGALSSLPCSPLCGNSGPPALSLTLMQWTCAADCQYQCMWAMESAKVADAGSRSAAAVEKYHGKWPFVRVYGMQEPASVAFSLLNLLSNLHCAMAALRRRRLSAATGPPPARLWGWVAHFALSCNAWVWSAVFHCRDTRLTERLDYYSAGAAVAFNLFWTLARVWDLKRPLPAALLAVCVGGGYALHVQHMQLVLFDYGRHVALCMVAGAAQTLAWLAWGLATTRGRAHPGRPALLRFMALINLCMLLDILDFSPWWAVVDAHALWHAATAPLTYLWAAFVLADLQQLGDREQQPPGRGKRL